MRISNKKKAERKSKIYQLYEVQKMKKQEIAKELKIHRNTVGKYVKKLEK